MRILHIVGTISPHAGGPTEAIKMLIRHAPAGTHSEVATLDDPDALFLGELPFSVHALGSRSGSWYSPRLGPWLRAHRDRFDGAIVHGLWEYTGLAARRAFAGHLPFAIFAHGMLDPYFKDAFPNKHRKKWLYWLASEHWNLRAAHRVLFTTELERNLASESFFLHQWQSAVVPLGAEAPPAHSEATRKAFFTHCPEVEGKRFLLFLGRINHKKGCDLLVQAFAEQAAAAPDLHLVMAGPDPDGWQPALQAIAFAAGCGHRVHWPGMLRGSAKWGAFAASEAFILPSHQENFGIAAVEAIASGKPVLLSRPVNLAPDLVEAGCALSEGDTLKGTKRLIARWLALPAETRGAMGERGRALFARRFQMERNTRAILQTLQVAPAETAVSAPALEAR